MSTGLRADKLLLKEVWETLKYDTIFYDQMGITMSRQLSQKLKAKDYAVKSKAGKLTYVFGIVKNVFVAESSNEDED